MVNYNISSLQLSKRMSHDVFLSNGTTRLVCNTLSQNRVFQGSVRLQNIRCEPFFSKVLKLTSLCFASFFFHRFDADLRLMVSRQSFPSCLNVQVAFLPPSLWNLSSCTWSRLTILRLRTIGRRRHVGYSERRN